MINSSRDAERNVDTDWEDYPLNPDVPIVSKRRGLSTMASWDITDRGNLWVLCPHNDGMNLARPPVRRQVDHTLVRPLRVLSEGGRNPGVVRYGVFTNETHTVATIGYAMVFAGKHENAADDDPFPWQRVIVFPPAGAGVHLPLRNGSRESHPVDHVTIERNHSSHLDVHISLPRQGTAKERRFTSRRLRPTANGEFHLGTIAYRSLSSMDPAGFAMAPVGPGLAHRPDAKKLLAAALDGPHPVHEVSGMDSWGPEQHLELHFVASTRYMATLARSLKPVPATFLQNVKESPDQRLVRSAAIKGPGRIVTGVSYLEPGATDGWAVHWSNQGPRARAAMRR